jgi:glycerol-3-phosphate dehydrogenase
MKRNLNTLAEEKFDVLVVGCGIYGAATVREAAQRGLKAAVIDSRDFCGATSANSLKIIHGGLRYLQQLDIIRVLESCNERKNMMRIAPHIVHPLPCVMPTRPMSMKSQQTMAVAMLMYDTITCKRNSLQDAEKYIPRGRVISKDDCLKIIPGINPSNLSGAAEWSDAYANSTERLCVSMVSSAVDAGAQAANYLKMTGFLESDNTVVGIRAKDMLSDREIEIKADLVILNTGPWTNHMLSLLDAHSTKPINGLALGMNVIVNKEFSSRYAFGLSCPKGKNSKERLLFFMPWHGKTMIGTYYRAHNGHPNEIKVTDEDIELFLKDINSAYPPAKLTSDDILLIHAGLLPTKEATHNTTEQTNGSGPLRDPALSNHPTFIDHSKADAINGLLTVVGVKYTTARNVAEKTIDIAFRKLKQKPKPSISAETPLPGGDIKDYNGLLAHAELNHHPKYLINNYGTNYNDIIKNSDIEHDTLKAEIEYIINEEMPETLADLMFRRTSIASTGMPSDEAINKIAEIMAENLHWDSARVTEEIRQTKSVQFPGSETF